MSYYSVIQQQPNTYSRNTTEVVTDVSVYSSANPKEIIFTIPSAQLVDTNSAYFQADVTITNPTGNTNSVVSLDNPGLGALFSKITISNSANQTLYESENVAEQILFNVRNRGRDYQDAALQMMGYNPALDDVQLNAAGVTTDATGAADTVIGEIGYALGKNGNSQYAALPGTPKVMTLSVPWSLINCPLALTKGAHLPAYLMSEKGGAMRIVLTLNNATRALVMGKGAATAAMTFASNPTYELSNVKMVFDCVNLGTKGMQDLDTLANAGKLSLHYNETVVHRRVNENASTGIIDFSVNKFTNSLKNVQVGFKPSAESLQTPNISWFGKYGLNSLQIQAGPKLAPGQAIDCSKESSGNMYAELVKCSKSLFAGGAVPFWKNYNNGTKFGTFAAGVNLSDIEYSDSANDQTTTLSGLNTSSTSQVVLRIRRATPVGGPATPFDIFAFLTSDNTLTIGGMTSGTRALQ